MPDDVKLPERDNSKLAEQQGLFRKFNVTRVDGSDAPGERHHGCRYYVLDIDCDPHAKAALTAYAAACEQTHPILARDLREKWGAASLPSDIDGLVEELERGLEGTSDGPWHTHRRSYDIVVRNDDHYLLRTEQWGRLEPADAAQMKANAEHVARCSPDNIRKLIAALRTRQAPAGDDWPFRPISEWKQHDGSDVPPDGLEEQVVEIERRGPDAEHWRVTEAHHVEWKHTGGKEDVLLWRFVERVDPSRQAPEGVVEAAHAALPPDRQLYVTKDDLRAALSAMPSGAVKVKALTWIEDRGTSSYASVEFGPETLFYSLSLVDEQLDAWSVETGFHCSEFGAREVHKCVGRENARQAAQDYHRARILSALEGQPL